MQLIQTIDSLPRDLGNTVMTIGNFDGLHIGHQVLIRRLQEHSKRLAVPSVLMTFHPHPLRVLSPDHPLQLINSFDEMVAILKRFGIDYLLSIPFTPKFSHGSAEDFLKDVIMTHLHPLVIVVGQNHRFGNNRYGDIQTLRDFGQQHDIWVEVISPVILDGMAVSSTLIRDLIRSGELEQAEKLLGHPYRITGSVQEGMGRGRQIGYPTANLSIKDKVIPPHGVYATQTTLNETVYPSISYLGQSPTFDGKDIIFETHLLDYSGDLYGRNIAVDLLHWIRPEMIFSDVVSLLEQIRVDIQTAKTKHNANRLWVIKKGTDL